MSKNKQPRHDCDNYPTPSALALKGWELAQEYSLRRTRILEPGCGDAQPFLQCALDGSADAYCGCDIRDVQPVKVEISLTQCDFLTEYRLGYHAPFDVIMANPPYVHAAEFAAKSLELISPWGCVVFLCRQSFHAKGRSRERFWDDHPPTHVSTISPRPSFTGDGKTDGAEYAYFVWAPWVDRVRSHDLGIDGRTTLGWTTWNKPRSKRLLK